MKFLHIGDLHLGRSIGEFDLIEDQKYILDQILDIAKQREVDAVLVAGDVYDKSVPSEAAVRLFDYFIRRFAEEGLRAFIISGNHDSDERMNFGSSLFRANGIYIAAKYEGELMHLRVKKGETGLEVSCVEYDSPERHELVDEDGEEVNIYLMPFIKASQVRHFFPEEGIENYEDAVRAVLKHAGVDPTRKNVLVAHQFVAGSASVKKGDGERIREISADREQVTPEEESAVPDDLKKAEREKKREKSYTDPVLSGSEGIATQNVGLVEKIGADCFDAFDYVALGHIHSPQSVGREEVRYSGSPLKYSLSEANHVKSVPIVTLGKKGEVQVELVPLRPMRDLRHIRGRMEQLLAKENITAPDDFIYATLTDEDVIDEAMGIFQQYYPNTIRIEYDNSHTKGIQEPENAAAVGDVSFDELIMGFYRQMYGCDISAEEMKLMRESAREAGLEIGEDEILTEDGISTGDERVETLVKIETQTKNEKEDSIRSKRDENSKENGIDEVRAELKMAVQKQIPGKKTGNGGDAN